ncbi:MAG: D-alanyl-D-alanine carboxypeptidase/D-alanyl-D-alanine-endopeptidase [Geodermatophilaceae bacterium]|nr:D-alanyl-D-alanine carboxypeptidase/D-alanyl-D-alanine-endopeptidase [Geodermatophilaceae bacterium]
MPARRAELVRPSRARRLLLVLLALVLVAAAGVTTVVLVNSGSESPPPGLSVFAVPEPVLPDLAVPEPVLADDAGNEPIPDPAALAAILAPTLADPRLGGRLLASVVDVVDGQVLFEASGAQSGTPASNAKLLTAFAALSTLDPGDRLSTSVVAGSTAGEIVLVGGGDATLSRTAPSLSYPGAPTVADLAQQVLGNADTEITGIVVDSSLYTGPSISPLWRTGDAPSTYAAPVTATMVDGGRISPGSRSRSGTPALDAGAALAAALGRPDLPVVAGLAPPEAALLALVESAPISRLVETMLALSDNVLAESLARHVALARGQSADFTGGAIAVTDAVAAAGLDTTGLTVVDGSGLSADNAVPPRLLTDLLRAVAAEDGNLDLVAISSGLPVAGYDGTLVDRYEGGPTVGAGSVRAKSGTLDGVNTLAGYVVTAEGRVLAFALIADQLPPGGQLIGGEPVLDAFAGVLASCGCR